MRRFAYGALLTAMIGGLAEPAGAEATTIIDVVAIYAIDSDTYELVRYAFDTDTFMVIGVVETAGGETIRDCEALVYIGDGPNQGMYAVPTKDPYEDQLVKIDPLTAEATVIGPAVCPAGRKITGMAAVYIPGLDVWYLLAASSEDLSSDPDRIESRELLRIDPATGTSVIEATQADLGDGRRFEGLGIDYEGRVWAVSRQWFYRIDQDNNYAVTELAFTGLDKSEAFEVALGDSSPSIDVPGVDPSWTTNGVFFVADEALQKFGVLNPADGSFQEYLVGGSPSSFVTKDAEGMVLLTRARDPLFGIMVTFD